MGILLTTKAMIHKKSWHCNLLSVLDLKQSNGPITSTSKGSYVLPKRDLNKTLSKFKQIATTDQGLSTLRALLIKTSIPTPNAFAHISNSGRPPTDNAKGSRTTHSQTGTQISINTKNAWLYATDPSCRTTHRFILPNSRHHDPYRIPTILLRHLKITANIGQSRLHVTIHPTQYQIKMILRYHPITPVQRLQSSAPGAPCSQSRQCWQDLGLPTHLWP